MIFTRNSYHSEDPIEELAGKLYRGADSIVKNSGIVMINLIIGAILLLDQPIASWDVFIYSMLLPVPTWIFLSAKNSDQQKLNNLLIEQLNEDEIYSISIKIEDILKIKDRYSDDYNNKIKEFNAYLDLLLETRFPLISKYYREGNVKLRFDSLAFHIYNRWKKVQSATTEINTP